MLQSTLKYTEFCRVFIACGAFLVCSMALAADTPAGTPAENASVETKLTIVNIASHCDWSWAHTRAWHENRYAEMIHDYLLLMRQNPKLVWQLETVNEQLQPFLGKAERAWPEVV